MCLNSSEMLGITNRLTLLEKFPYSEFLWFVFFRIHTAQKIKFSIKSFFSKCDQICRKLRIWSHLLKKSLMENFIFNAASDWIRTRKTSNTGTFYRVLMSQSRILISALISTLIISKYCVTVCMWTRNLRNI